MPDQIASTAPYEGKEGKRYREIRRQIGIRGKGGREIDKERRRQRHREEEREGRETGRE